MNNKQRYTLVMTQDDISMGIRGSCDKCPIAVLMNRTLPDGPYQVWLSSFNSEYFFEPDGELPAIARDFIRVFDEGGYPEPIVFAVEI